MRVIKNPILVINRSGGEQPALFAPIISKNYNTVSFSNNPANGDFNVNIVGMVDGVEVTSPFTITQIFSGAALTVTASANRFVSASTTLVLEYSTLPESVFQGYFRETTEASYKYLAFGFNSVVGANKLYKGNSFTSYSYATSTGDVTSGLVNTTIPLILQATASGTLSGEYRFNQLSNEADSLVSYTEPMSGGAYLTGTVRIIDNDTNQEVWTKTYNNDILGYNGNNQFSFTATNGHLYYLVFEGQFS